MFFRPYFMPILGKYNDYGRLSPDPNDPSLPAIEAIFGKDFFEEPNDYIFKSQVPNIDLLKHIDHRNHSKAYNAVLGLTDIYFKNNTKVSGCFIHKWAFDLAYEHVLKNETNVFNSHVTSKVLEYMGFSLLTEDDESKTNRYYLTYAKDGFDAIIKSDTHYIELIHKNKTYSNIYYVKDLNKIWQQLFAIPLFDKKTLNALKLKPSFEVNYWNDALETVKKKKNYINLLNKCAENNSLDILDNVNSDLDDLNCNLYKDSMDSIAANMLFNSCHPSVDIMRFKTSFSQIEALFYFMQCNSKLLMPVVVPPQCCDRDSELALITASYKYLVNKHIEPLIDGYGVDSSELNEIEKTIKHSQNQIGKIDRQINKKIKQERLNLKN